LIGKKKTESGEKGGKRFNVKFSREKRELKGEKGGGGKVFRNCISKQDGRNVV